MLKIMQLTAQVPAETGSGTFLQNLMREAEKKNYQQAFLAGIPTGKNKNSYPIPHNIDFFPVKFETEKLPFPVVGMSDNMPYKSTKYKDMDYKMLGLWFNAFTQKINEAVEVFKPDIIISHHIWLLSALLKNLFPNIFTICICHGTGLRQMKNTSELSNYVIKGCSKMEGIAVLNDYQKKILTKKLEVDKEKFFIIESGYNSEIFYPSINIKNKNNIKLVYAGKLSRSKGIMSLLKAYEKINLKDKNIELILVGSGNGDELNEIKKLAEKTHNKIIFTGNISQKKLANIFRQSDIFILPSFYEGLPLVLIEALSCGMRIVTTDLPGIREFLGEKINNSGLISYVKIPQMINCDVPIKKSLPVFEESLKNKILEQIDYTLKNIYIDNKIYAEISHNKSWTNVFNRLENYFEATALQM